MRYHVKLLGMVLAAWLCLPMSAYALWAHNTACNECHKRGANPRAMSNVCTPCHGLEKGNFGNSKASDALGSHPDHLTPALITGDPGDQTSHFWGGSSTANLGAGSTHPPSTFYTSRYSISTRRVTCSICHDPHKEAGTLLLRKTKVDDLLCQQCHTGFFLASDHTHPIGDYAAAYNADTSTPKKLKPAGDLTNDVEQKIPLQGIVLINGKVSCSSCHAPHFADSDSSTLDGYSNVGALKEGDGHMLKADGPSKVNNSALCQTCHTYMAHGKIASTTRVGCQTCHSGHNIVGNNNVYVLRNSVTIDGTKVPDGTKIITYTTAGTIWNDNVAVTATGYCEVCHGSAETIDKGVSGKHLIPADNDCRRCHKHQVNGGTYSFQNDANEATCGDCHGFPPYKDIRGDRLGDDSLYYAARDGGYAYTSTTHNYLADTTGFKTENTTPHNTHAAGGMGQGAATDYIFGSGIAACDPCHLNKSQEASHSTLTAPGSYQDTAWNDLATGRITNGSTAIMAPVYKITVGTGRWGCTLVYCHSNGGKRPASGAAKVFADFTFPATAPLWPNGKGTIVGQAAQCNFCHGNTALTMASTSGNKYNSQSHQKHLGAAGGMGKTYSCTACHATTADSSTALTTGTNPRLVKDGGTHVNGVVNVSFKSTYSLGNGTLGTASYDGGAAGTCTTYCHSNGRAPYTAIITADWDNAASGACGACHSTAAASLSLPHSKHLAIATVTCNDCHFTVSGDATLGTHTGHVDGTFTFSQTACNNCHGWLSGEKTPVWYESMDNAYCLTCHAGTTVGVVKTMTAPSKQHATDRGHNRTTNYTSGNQPGNKQCTSCHLTNITNHVNVTDGDATHLVAAATTCTATCHGVGGTASANTRGMVTHVDRVCTDCHDPHGDTTLATNIYMVRSVKSLVRTGVGNYSGSAVSFTNRGNDLNPPLATDSFDEVDAANADDLCATCHTYGTHPLSTHNTKTNQGIAHHEGETCMTASCHKGHNEAAGAFVSGGGTACNGCHGNPPLPGDVRHTDAKIGAHKAHAHSVTHNKDLVTHDATDCDNCHPGASSYTYTPGGLHGSGNLALGMAGGITGCSSACHLSGGADGFWTDTANVLMPTLTGNGLNCNACHYYDATPTSGENIVKPLTGSHNKHFDKSKVCSNCHSTTTGDYNNGTGHVGPMTHINNWTDVTDFDDDGALYADRAAATQEEAGFDEGGGIRDVTPMTYNDANNCSGTGLALGCHNTKTTPAWNAGSITCTNCHDVTGSAAADPKSGLHNMSTAGVQKHDSTITGGCAACHNSTKPANHADGTWQADQANNTESRFLNRSGLVYNDTAGPNQGSCFDNGAIGAGSLDYVTINCHRDNGVWKRLWSTDADNAGTTPGAPRCKVCHGQYSALNTNQGGGWNEGTSHNLTEGGRASIRGESHNRQGGDANACEDCHSFPSLSNHENNSLTMNDAGATGITVQGTWVRCNVCHTVNEDPLVPGTFTFTQSTAFSVVGVAGGSDPIAQCNSCHGAGGSGRFWPVAINGGADNDNHIGRHEIHMARLALKVYGESVAQLLTTTTQTSEIKQKNLCEYCHTAPAGFNGHHLEALPAEVVIANLWNKAADNGAAYVSNQHGAVGVDTCAGVNCHNNKLTVDNFYGWYDSATGSCIVCHTVGGTNDLPNFNIHPNSGLHSVTPTVSGVRHDDSFSTSGNCASCHTGIVSAMVGGTHINGAAVADSGVNTNAERGLFTAYSEAAINSGTCAGSGVNNTVNCHADAGAWNRRWSTTASASNGIDECANCHGTFAGWRTVRTNHVDPYTGVDQTPAHDSMGTVGEHPDCSICHGWGKGESVYSTTWHNKIEGTPPGHGDGKITMNGPQPTTGAGYNAGTGGCTAACHSATWVMGSSTLTVNYGDYGGGTCFGCHGDNVSQYWPDGTPSSPVYADNSANSAARHNTHILAISQYKWGENLTALKALSGNGTADAKQKAVCAFCHPSPGAAGHNSNAGLDDRVDIVAATYFQKFSGGGVSERDVTSGAYSGGTSRSCANLVCHNLVTTPTVAADSWEGTTAANCTTLCHGPNTVATAREGHQKHVVSKGYGCVQCHPANTGLYGHINGMVNILFAAGSLEQSYGSATAGSYVKGSVAYNRNPVTSSTCALIYCHVDKTTPAWSATISTTTGCVDCHTAGGVLTNPTSSLHDMTPRITGKQHSNSFAYGVASTAYCSTCHTTQPTVVASNHVNGVFSSTIGAAGNTIINFAAGVGFIDGTTPTCGATLTGCHKDAGVWKRKWHENSTSSVGLECAGCHGDWTRTWNTGVIHRSDTGPTSNHPAGTLYKCKDCHAFEATTYGSLAWGGNHGDSKITINSNATSFARGTAGDAGKSGCATSCHVAFDGTASGQHSFTTTAWTLQLLSGDTIDAGCNGCHGNTSVGVGQFWPDGSGGNPSYADDNLTSGANHLDHITAIAVKRYNENITLLLTDNTAGHPTLKSSDKQKAICAYCHPSPGGTNHSLNNSALPSGSNRADLHADGDYLHIITGIANGSGVFNYDTDGTCSTIKCHARAPFTPGWLGDHIVPGTVTLTAVTHLPDVPPGTHKVGISDEPGSVRLSWLAPGDDGSQDGTAYKYDLRYSQTQITDETTFNAAKEAEVPTVKRKGQAQSMVVTGLEEGIPYFFALKTYDETGQVSPIAATTVGVTAHADDMKPVFWGVSSVSATDHNFDITPNPDTNSVYVSWEAGRDHSHSLTDPLDYLVLWSEYSLRTHFTNNGAMPATIGTDACFNKSFSPPTLITCGTGGVNEYRIKSAETTALDYNVTGLPVGTVYNFLVRARDANFNIDTNRADMMAMAKSTSFKTIALQTQRTSGTIPAVSTGWTGLPGGSTSASDAALGADYPASAPTAFTLGVNAVAVWSPTTTYSVPTNVWGLKYQIKITASTTGATTLTYQFGYLTGKAFTAFGTAKTMSLAKRSPIRLISFPLNSYKGTIPTGSKPAFVLKGGAYSVTLTYGSEANKGGMLLFNAQDYNALPTGIGSVTSTEQPSTFVGGPIHRITWTPATPVAGQTFHYDVFATVLGKEYVVGRNITTPTVDWDPVGDGITGAPAATIKVMAGNGYRTGAMINNGVLPLNADNVNHIEATGTINVNNSTDRWKPAAIGDLKVETRPKQGAVNLTWKAVGNDGFNHGTRATKYDIRFSLDPIPNSATFDALPNTNWAKNEPYPEFSGAMESYELVGLQPDLPYYFAMKVGDLAGNWSDLSNVVIEPSGPKCGICHSTPPDEPATAGNHVAHGYTKASCGDCHGFAAADFGMDHQDNNLYLGWKTAFPVLGVVNDVAGTVTYTQNSTLIYSDTDGVGGFNVTTGGAEKLDNGTCSGFNGTNASGCHGPAAPKWDPDIPLACSACHGTSNRTTDQYSRAFDATLDNAGVVPDQIKAAPAADNHGTSSGRYVGAHLKHLNSSFRLAKGDNCKLCHNDNIHGDGNVDVTYDYNVVGANATWRSTTLGINGGGTCTQTSEVNCHGTSATPPEWHSSATVACNQCHGFGGVDPAHVSDGVARNCLWCHPAGHPQGTEQDPNSIMIPNNPMVGIAYRSGGIHLLKNINSRGVKTTEAEVCWGCHDNQGTKISEWGTNKGIDTTTDQDALPDYTSPYNYGALFTTYAGSFSGPTSNWLGTGTGAYWQSGTGAFQNIKAGKIQSTHSTKPGALSTVAYDATNKRYNESLDAVADLRCSNCHDVHNMNKAENDIATGTPYLRGTWRGNPYNEDGPPVTTTTYVDVPIDIYGMGAVPRGGTGYRRLGGYFIDQNNVVPMTASATATAALADYPTTGWTNESSAGLCILCHGNDVDNMDQRPGESLWLGTNGHSNSAIGGTFTNGVNIFVNLTGGLTGLPTPVGTAAISRTTQVPDMAYQMQPNTTTTTRGYGYRGLRGGGDSGEYAPMTATLYAYNAYDWGATVSSATDSIDQMYHQFSCSKCHNPHASRLPKLLITNCLDVQHNTWTVGTTAQTLYTATALRDVDKNTTGTVGYTAAYYASAQNCHRYNDKRTAVNKGGWNKVSPWTTANQ